MKVSVIMPVYNAGGFLRDSIDSILNQSYKDFEFIIINDGSTDDSLSTIQSYTDERIRLFNNEKNLGLIATLNKGLSLVKGEYIARQDADDISLLNRLEVQVKVMDQYPELLLLSSNAFIVNKNNEVLGDSSLPSNEISLRFRMLFKCGIFHTSTIFRKRALDQHKLTYDPSYPHSEDYKLWSEISRKGSIHTLEDKLVRYRTHGDSVSNRNKQKQEEIVAIVVRENIRDIGVEISIQEAVRLRGLFRASGIDRKFLKHDLKLLINIIRKFRLKYKNHEGFEITEIRQLLTRMTGWISKADLINIQYLLIFIYLKALLLTRYR